MQINSTQNEITPYNFPLGPILRQRCKTGYFVSSSRLPCTKNTYMQKAIFSAMIAFCISLTTTAQNTIAETTDSMAKATIALMNAGLWDSAYQATSSSFQKNIPPQTWKTVSKQLSSLLPFSKPVFETDLQGVRKYKLQGGGTNFQLLLQLNTEQKIETLLLQPYSSSTQKAKACTTDNPLKTKQDSTIHQALIRFCNTTGNVGASVALINGGKVQFYNYGETELGNNRLPNKTTAFEIGSVTKTFIATQFAYALQQNKANLQQYITAYLPDSIQNIFIDSIKIVQLLNHSSGLPRLPYNLNFTVANALQPYENYGTNDVMKYLQKFEPMRVPGTQYEYSNLAFGLAGILLERIYQQPLEKILMQYIWQPLQMKNTSFSFGSYADTATPYNAEGKTTPAWKFAGLAGCGAIKSTTEDLAKYVLLQLGQIQIPKALANAVALTHQNTYTDSSYQVALGWHMETTSQGLNYHHSGGTYGSRSLVIFNPQRKMGLVVLANSATNADAVAMRLFKKLLE
jgi:CubicO group peptidase (beta-lactamase class C family)